MGKINYKDLDLKKLGKIGKSASGSEFEVKKWDEMEEGEEYIQQMLLVGVKTVNTQYGENRVFQFQDPNNLDDKRAVWGNKIVNDAYECGDLVEADYMLYTITYNGKVKIKGSKNSYSALEIMCYDLRKLGFESEEAEEEEEIEEVETEEEELEEEEVEAEEEEEEEAPPVKKAPVRKATPAKAPLKKAPVKKGPMASKAKAPIKKSKTVDDIVDDLV